MRAMVLVLAGCSAAPHTTAATPPPPRPAVPAPTVRAAPAPAPELARPELTVFLPDPLVALDPDHAEPWPCQAKAREGALGGYGLAIPAHRPLDVVAVERERLRVVIDHAGGRVLVWVPRGAFIASVMRETAVATRPGGPLPRSFDPGIFVGPGADVDDGRDGWWHLRGTSELALDGWIPNDAVADWYLPPPPARYSLFGSYESRGDGHGLVAQGTVVRATPHADGLALATALVDHDIRIGRQLGDWRELDLDDDGVRVHGFIPETAWHPYPSPYGVGTGGGRGGFGVGTIGVGHGIGRSRPRPVPTVPSGTCIVDADGNRIGRVTRDLFEPMPAPDAGGRIPVPAQSPGLWYRRCY